MIYVFEVISVKSFIFCKVKYFWLSWTYAQDLKFDVRHFIGTF